MRLWDGDVMKKNKIEWIEWLGLALVCCIFYLVSFFAVSALFSNDRWVAFGTVGTWVTGSIAGGIAVAQFIDLRLRRRKLYFKSHASINRKIDWIAPPLNIAIWAVRVSFTTGVRKKSVQQALRGIRCITINSTEEEYLPSFIVSELKTLNNWMKKLQDWLSLYTDEEHFQWLNSNKNVSQFFEIAQELITCIEKIHPESPCLEDLKEEVLALGVALK